MIYNIENLPNREGNYIAVGSFDGIHLGHQEVINTALKREKISLLTYTPHPQVFLRKITHSFLITEDKEKEKILHKMGVDDIIFLRFTEALSKMHPEEFLRQVFCDRLKPSCIVVGEHHNFGVHREGTPKLMKDICKKWGIEVIIVDSLRIKGERVSSTAIRKALWNGDINKATRFLGRYWTIKGRVKKGTGRGKEIGFPTANITLDEPLKIVPKKGVYAVFVQIDGEEYKGMLNIGIRPTFNEKKEIMEVHIIGFNRDIYNYEIEISFIERIRDEKRFDNDLKLKERLKTDKDKVIELIGSK